VIVVAAFVAGAVGAYIAVRPSGSRSTAILAPPTGSRPTATHTLVPAQPRNCTPTITLVNPCRPWFGAVAAHIPGLPPSRVTDFKYLERLIGHPLDIFRDYHSPPGTGRLGDLPLNSDEITMARRADTYVDVNWKPASTWAQADGGNPSVNSEIARAAASIKSVAPHKIFLSIWWEPQRYVTSDPTNRGCHVSPTAPGGGTPAQFVAMWRNVEKIFRQNGVTNVVWTMDYQDQPKFNCLVPQLWPGNNLVDWVLYDAYSRNAQDTWDKTVGPFYYVLLHDSNARVNFDSKPWGLGEFGVCSNPDMTLQRQFYLQAKQAVQANTYPRLKMYLAFNSAGGPKAGPGCLSNYTAQGQPDAVKQADFNQFASAVLAHR
jgi:hypothetical protein